MSVRASINCTVSRVTVPPNAVPGGPYTGEACKPVMFNASGSSDPNGQITAYAWDFTDDGTFDVSSAAALYLHTYPSAFNGQARLKVTDNEGFIDEATTGVTITPDVTAPVITNVTATPGSLWPVNHQMRPVSFAVSVADACGSATCRIVSVASSEAANERGVHRLEPDDPSAARRTDGRKPRTGVHGDDLVCGRCGQRKHQDGDRHGAARPREPLNSTSARGDHPKW